jgi:hypothetical protein
MAKAEETGVDHRGTAEGEDGQLAWMNLGKSLDNFGNLELNL